MLFVFIFLESLWLAFGLCAGQLTILVAENTMLSVFGFLIPSSSFLQSTLSFIAGIYQDIALFFPGVLIGGVLATEWEHFIHAHHEQPLFDELEEVFHLTHGGFMKNIRHILNRRPSAAFCLALSASCLLIPLHSFMSSTITVGQGNKFNSTSLTIGILPFISTFGGGQGETDENMRNLQLAARDAYIKEVADSKLALVRSSESLMCRAYARHATNTLPVEHLPTSAAGIIRRAEYDTVRRLRRLYGRLHLL